MRYEHDTSHARKDRQKKSGEKAGRARTGGRGGRVVKVLYKDTQTEATAGSEGRNTRCRARGESAKEHFCQGKLLVSTHRGNFEGSTAVIRVGTLMVEHLFSSPLHVKMMIEILR